MALIAAALAAQGTSELAPLETVERGYGALVERLQITWCAGGEDGYVGYHPHGGFGHVGCGLERLRERRRRRRGLPEAWSSDPEPSEG